LHRVPKRARRGIDTERRGGSRVVGREFGGKNESKHDVGDEREERYITLFLVAEAATERKMRQRWEKERTHPRGP